MINPQPLQAVYLSAIDKCLEINERMNIVPAINNNLTGIRSQIDRFKVVVPIIGKFSSGKSTLLNTYLDDDYLPTDITPETAFATELHYSENEYLMVHYLGNWEAEQRAVNELTLLNSSSDTGEIAYVQAFINNEKLKLNPNIVLVDMPGFDARNAAHEKAISLYLARGDFFVCLMAADIPYDASVLNRLTEIRVNYGKSIACLISKAGRKSQSLLADDIQTLGTNFSQHFGENITIGTVEVRRSAGVKLEDFEKQIVHASACEESLLSQRYGVELVNLVEQLEKGLQSVKNFTQSNEADFEQKVKEAETAFQQAESKLKQALTQMEHNLCSLGRERIEQRVRSALISNIERLKQAAKGNQLNEVLVETLRPVAQIELNQMLQAELQRLETCLHEMNSATLTDIHIAVTVPIHKESESELLSPTLIGAALSWVLAKLPVKISPFLALLGGLLTKQVSHSEKDRQLEELIREQVIPGAMSQIIAQVSSRLLETAQTLRQKMGDSFDQQKQTHLQTIKEIKEEQAGQRQQFEARIHEYDRTLEQLRLLKTTLTTKVDQGKQSS